MFGSLLIANRGEIAVRIIRTCRRLGIRTVAVYSDADADALHVALADEAVHIGPPPARDSYLRPDAIVEAARRTGAEAVHPGYGFLSEKPELPEACTAAGLVFVGPSARCIAAMGSKIGAKKIAAEAGVASVPGYAGAEQSTARLVEEARGIGFPLMVKASAGGGGKGMRRVMAEDELVPALDLARREAEAAFGDPSLLIERLVLRPRHLEVQIAGDTHGNVVHLYERDCSVQRNHQKVLEEAPAPNLPETVRQALLERSVALGRTIAYDNLGTVEFILDEGAREPWFLEMNTRLQVEHPVTEAVTGFDLVEWQLRIAAGESLPARQDEIACRGHAIEARVTAERADAQFRPDAGPIRLAVEPDGIRVDAGVRTGSEVTLFYDSLLAKVIAAGRDRPEALRRLEAGLRRYVVLGPATTLPFLADAVAHPIFAEGRATTRFIEEAFPAGWPPAARRLALARAVAAALRTEAARPPGQSPWSALTGFRVLAHSGAAGRVAMRVEDDSGAESLSVGCTGSVWSVTAGEESLSFALTQVAARIEVTVDGVAVPGWAAVTGDRIDLWLGGETYAFKVQPDVAGAASARQGAGHGVVRAPMPGLLAELRVGPGETVEAGQTVAVLESMKLLISLSADVAGVVQETNGRPGETVEAGQALVVITAAKDAA